LAVRSLNPRRNRLSNHQPPNHRLDDFSYLNYREPPKSALVRRPKPDPVKRISPHPEYPGLYTITAKQVDWKKEPTVRAGANVFQDPFSVNNHAMTRKIYDKTIQKMNKEMPWYQVPYKQTAWPKGDHNISDRYVTDYLNTWGLNDFMEGRNSIPEEYPGNQADLDVLENFTFERHIPGIGAIPYTPEQINHNLRVSHYAEQFRNENNWQKEPTVTELGNDATLDRQSAFEGSYMSSSEVDKWMEGMDFDRETLDQHSGLPSVFHFDPESYWRPKVAIHNNPHGWDRENILHDRQLAETRQRQIEQQLDEEIHAGIVDDDARPR